MSLSSSQHGEELSVLFQKVEASITEEHVRYLKEWALQKGDNEQNVAITALQNHLNEEHRLNVGEILAIAFYLNDGLLLDTDTEECNRNENAEGFCDSVKIQISSWDTPDLPHSPELDVLQNDVASEDDIESLHQEFEKLVQDAEK